jgi:hypothetical protein
MKRPTDAETIKRLKEKIKLLEKRLDAEILARDQLEEDLRTIRNAEHARASRASYGTGVGVRNGHG